MSEDPNQALPSLAFFLPQRSAQVGDHHQLMTFPALPEGRPSDAPPPACAGETAFQRSHLFCFEQVLDPEFLGGGADGALADLSDQAFGGAIQKSKLMTGVKGEHGDVNF